MKTFKLEKQPPGRTQTKFFVYDSADSIVGVITVPNEAAADLLAHWKDVAPSSPNTANAKRRNATAPMSAAFRKGPKLTGEARTKALLRAS
jgi:hypothetical protein